MKINALIFQNLLKTESKVHLRKGQIIKALVLEAEGNQVLLHLGDNHYIQGNSLVNLENNKNTLVNFLVKELDGEKIVLSPIDLGTGPEKGILINKILEENNLPITERNSEIIHNLIQYNMPVNKEIVDYFIKLMDRFEKLKNVNENQSIEVLSSMDNVCEEAVDKFVFSEKREENNLNSKENRFYPKVISLKNNEVFPKKTLEIFYEEEIDNLLKKGIFLHKINKTVSINNLLRLTDFIEKGQFFEDAISKIVQELVNQGKDDGLIEKSFLNIQHMIYTNKRDETIDYIKDYHNRLQEFIKILTKTVNQRTTENTNNKELIRDLNERVDLYQKMNTQDTFIYIPLTIREKNLKNKIYLLAKGKKGLHKNKYSIYMSLKTSNLDEIGVFCEISGSLIKAKVTLESREHVRYFEKYKEELKGTLIKIGFSQVMITSSTRENKNHVMELLANSQHKNYSLDIRV